MFTGIIAGQGEVAALSPAQGAGGQVRLKIRSLFTIDTPIIGESIAINGTCLTLESFAGNQFSFYASAETMNLSNLGFLKPGSKVNMERALALSDRLGGHLVSGHVDTLAQVEFVRPKGESLHCRLRFSSEWGKQVVCKGSVALDGISLTVNACGPDFLEVNVIPETAKITTVAAWKPGYAVNMETDMLGKYVQSMLAPRQETSSSRINEDFLRENGYF